MKPLHLVPGTSLPSEFVGAVLVRDLVVDGERWSKGRRLRPTDIAHLASPDTLIDEGPRGGEPGAQPGFTVLGLDEGEVHEDEAGLRLAAAVAGADVRLRGPTESRVDLVATAAGVLHVRLADLERVDRVDPLEVFTLLDGQTVSAGEVVASVKIGPHAVDGAVLDRGIALARQRGPIVRVARFLPRRVAVLVKDSARAPAREGFEEEMRARIESLGSTLTAVSYVPDDPQAVAADLGPLVRGHDRVDLVLVVGGVSTDPGDACFVGIEALGGRVVRRGVPANPGSMTWLARIGATDLLGYATYGAYAKATAADLLLPRLLTGERASARMAASLGYGGMLVRAMRFRFPPYAREPDAQDR